MIPDPIRGGTFFYCPWKRKILHGTMSCGVKKYNWASGSRFRTCKAYRRHYRKHHTETS